MTACVECRTDHHCPGLVLGEDDYAEELRRRGWSQPDPGQHRGSG